LFATTKAFLDDLNLSTLEELPPLDDLGSLVATVPAAETLPAGAEEESEEGPEEREGREVMEEPRRVAA
jgi:segregation and condensation protein B